MGSMGFVFHVMMSLDYISETCIKRAGPKFNRAPKSWQFKAKMPSLRQTLRPTTLNYLKRKVTFAWKESNKEINHKLKKNSKFVQRSFNNQKLPKVSLKQQVKHRLRIIVCRWNGFRAYWKYDFKKKRPDQKLHQKLTSKLHYDFRYPTAYFTIKQSPSTNSISSEDYLCFSNIATVAPLRLKQKC